MVKIEIVKKESKCRFVLAKEFSLGDVLIDESGTSVARIVRKRSENNRFLYYPVTSVIRPILEDDRLWRKVDSVTMKVEI